MAEVASSLKQKTRRRKKNTNEKKTTSRKKAARKKQNIRRSKKPEELKPEELLKALLQSTDILQNWTQIVPDLELQDTDQNQLITGSSRPADRTPDDLPPASDISEYLARKRPDSAASNFC
jgi:hypothetical protein